MAQAPQNENGSGITERVDGVTSVQNWARKDGINLVEQPDTILIEAEEALLLFIPNEKSISSTRASIAIILGHCYP
jgi:precorrin-2 methylase